MGLKKTFHLLLLVLLGVLIWLSDENVKFSAYCSSHARFGLAGLSFSTAMGFISSFDTEVDLVFFREAMRARGTPGFGVNGLCL